MPTKYLSATPQHAPPSPVMIIAEAGVNHNADPEMALRLVETAAQAGADAVKFQTFKTAELVSQTAPKAAYQKQTTGACESQFDMLRKLELDAPTHHRLAAHCQAQGIQFLSTPFDLPSLNFLLDRMHLTTLKMPSGELTNAPLLWQAATRGQRIILSTGMATLGEVEQALAVLACGYRQIPPSLATFDAAYRSPEGQQLLRTHVTLLHCTSAYPTPFSEVNLRAMDTLATAFGLPVGLSDHTPGMAVPVAAVARGAVVIEKHFTLDKTLPGPDHAASLDPAQLTEMIHNIRAVEMALGHGQKIPTAAEWNTRTVARKSLVALTAIPQGMPFTEANLGTKRPGTGISPRHYWQWLGRTATKNYQKDQLIEEDATHDH